MRQQLAAVTPVWFGMDASPTPLDRRQRDAEQSRPRRAHGKRKVVCLPHTPSTMAECCLHVVVPFDTGTYVAFRVRRNTAARIVISLLLDAKSVEKTTAWACGGARCERWPVSQSAKRLGISRSVPLQSVYGPHSFATI